MLNGTSLLANEWRDNIRLRYNHAPLDMPNHCDGCGAKLTVEHALSCKVSGVVHIRHDDVGNKWHHINGTAYSFRRVTREPRIHSSMCRQITVGAAPHGTTQSANNQNPDGATENDDDNNPITGERRDAGVHGFWERGRPCIFNVRITDTDARSYRNNKEKEKKDRYLQSCHAIRKDFTPLVYTVDGITGREANSKEKHLATALATK